MRNILNEFIERCSDKLRREPEFSDLGLLSDFKIDSESYNQIKVQLKALGLISLSSKKRSAKDSGTYWTLTPYGDFVMTQLLAIRR